MANVTATLKPEGTVSTHDFALPAGGRNAGFAIDGVSVQFLPPDRPLSEPLTDEHVVACATLVQRAMGLLAADARLRILRRQELGRLDENMARALAGDR